MKVQDIIDVMEKYYPLMIQEDWDNCGLQIGNRNQEVNKIMISLNADEHSLNEAIENGCQMLITHHPLLLGGLSNVDYDSPKGHFIYKAIENHVAVYSSHTSLDKVSMNQWLIGCLNVHDIQDGDPTGITKIGVLNQPLDMESFLSCVKDAYHLEHFQYAGYCKKISSVAVCGGSGSEFINELAPKVDAYLTGDTKFHQAQEAIEKGLLLVDIHHYAENIMVKYLKEQLQKEIDVEIMEGSSPDYYKYY